MEVPLLCVSPCEIRAVIRFFTAKNESPAAIHEHVTSVYGEKCMSLRTVTRWRKSFLEGRTNVHDDWKEVKCSSEQMVDEAGDDDMEDAVPDEEVNGEIVEILVDPSIACKQEFNHHDQPSRPRRAVQSQSKLQMAKRRTTTSISHEVKKPKLVLEHAPRFTEDKVPKTENLKENKMDEFYFFAMNVAEQLRALPVEKALKCQLEMQNILLEERLMQECERSNMTISFAVGESNSSPSR